MLLRLLIAAGLTLSGSTAFAQDTKTIDDQTICPIMTKKEVNDKSAVVEYQGIKIRMCCDTCKGRFEKYPEAYLDEKYIPQLNGLKIPERKIAQRVCPVYPDRVITERDPYVVYQGHVVYLFNKAAIKKWQKNPAKYAKAEYLPQLSMPVTPEEEAAIAAAPTGVSNGTSPPDEDEKETEGGK